MRKKPISVFIVTILLLAMLLGAGGAGIVGGWTSIAIDGSGYSHIRYGEDDPIECLPGAILCEMFDYEAEGA